METLRQIWRIVKSWEFWMALAIISGSALGVVIGQFRRAGLTLGETWVLMRQILPQLDLPQIQIVVHSSDNDWTILALMLTLFVNSLVVYFVIRDMRG